MFCAGVDYYKGVENHPLMGLQGVLHLLRMLIATPSEYSIFYIHARATAMHSTQPTELEIDNDEIAHLRELIKVYIGRLRKLELKAAALGGSCPPEIQNEIEKIEEKLTSLGQKARIAAEKRLHHHQEPPEPNLQANAPAVQRQQRERIACPYPGMVPFQAEDARFFYGRENDIRHMLQHLRARRHLLVVGPSGSGKSSLIHAGLLPALQQYTYFPQGFWLVRELRPGAEPNQALADAIGGDPARSTQMISALLAAHAPAQRLLLVIDQFEELFTQASRAEQAHFIVALQALQPLKACAFLLAMRADFYPDLMNSDLWPMAAKQRWEIAPLRGAALRQAIMQPAVDVGVRVEVELLERLLADAANEPGVLPLIQETMTLLWAEMRDNQLALGAYERMSGAGQSALAAALTMKADATLDDLSPAQQQIARRIFLRLIQFGEGRADTRRQQTVAALRSARDDPALFTATLHYLTDNRLLTLSGVAGGAEKADLAHEALISSWPMLQSWLSERREAEQTRRRLEAHVAEWERLGRGNGGLLDEVELAEAERWLAGPDADELGIDLVLPELVQASRAAIAEVMLRQLSEQARRRAADTLREIAQMLTSVSAPAEITTLILDQLQRVVAYDTASLLLRQGDGLHLTATRGLVDPPYTHVEQVYFGLPEYTSLFQIVQTRQPQIFDGAQAEPYVIPVKGREHIRRWIGVPLLLDNEVIGALTLGSTAIAAYGSEDTQLALTLAKLAAQAIHNTRMFDEVHRFAAELEQRVVERTAALAEVNKQLSDEKERLQAVHEITMELAQSLDLEATLIKALELASGAVGAKRGSIMLRDLATETLMCRAVLADDGAVRATNTPIRFSQGSGLAGWVMKHQQPIHLPDVRKDPRWIYEAGRADTVRSVIAIPLVTKN